VQIKNHLKRNIERAQQLVRKHVKSGISLVDELSLGDRACLLLGLAMKAPVYAADRSWNKVRVGLRIHIIR
jgi:PIN domain nuclease of toxin-antitoxin system